MPKPAKDRTSHRIDTFVPPNIYKELNELAKALKLPRSTLMRQALIRFLERHQDD